MLLSGRTALVTGAARGIGQAIASRFADEECDVIMTDILLPEGEAAAEEIRARGGKARFIALNVTDEQAVERTFASLEKLDIVVNNAGRTKGAPLEHMSLQEWNDILTVNLASVFLCCKAALPLLAQSPAPAIVTMSSVNAFDMNPNLAAYAAAKAGIVALTRQLAMQYAPQGIRANCISPGRTTWQHDPPEGEDVDQLHEIMTDCYPLGRFAYPHEVAGAALFLASDLSSFVNGVNLVVDGGLSLQSVAAVVRPDLRQRWKPGKYRLERE